MNIHIDETIHEQLELLKIDEHVVGSHMYGTNTEDSDKDIICIYETNSFKYFKDLEEAYIYDSLPNRTPLQYKDKENNIDYIWMTKRQFYQNLFAGDSPLWVECYLWSMGGDFRKCITSKILRCLNGFCKRDLKKASKNHPSAEKYKLHATRMLYLQNKLLNETEPILGGWNRNSSTIIDLGNLNKVFKQKITGLSDKGLIPLYPSVECTSQRHQLIADANNTKEFKYE